MNLGIKIGSSKVLVELGEADQDSLFKVGKIAKTVTHAFHYFNRVINPFNHLTTYQFLIMGQIG